MNKYITKKYYCLLRNLVTLFTTLIVSSVILLSASVATALDIRDVDQLRIATFDPTYNKPVLFSAQDQNFPEGAVASKIIENADVEVVVNGGFFDRGEHGSPGLIESFKEKYWAPDSAGYAFPSAILIIKGKLLSDTDHYLPAIGISDNGEVKFGEVKVVWHASCFKNGSKFLLDRFSKMDQDATDIMIYYKDENKNITEISLSDSKVFNIRPISEIDLSNKKPNSFFVHDPSTDTINELKSLKQGDNISITYELKAAVYTAVGEANNEDRELSSFFNNCPYVVSGGQLLIYNGEVDPRSTKIYAGRSEAYSVFGTAICIHKNESPNESPKVSLIVDKTGGVIRGGRIPKDTFINLLKNENCDQVMSLDGGKSSIMLTKKADGEYEEVGNRRIISDVLAILPHSSSAEEAIASEKVTYVLRDEL